MKDNKHDTSKLRRRMIQETEVDLNRRLDGPNVKWPRRCSPEQRSAEVPRRSRAGDANAVDRPMSVRQLWLTATVVEVRGNEHGYLDNDRVGAMVDTLLELASDERGGAFVVDLTSVRSLNAAFLTLVATLRRTLASRGRRLSLCGMGSQNADLLRGTGLDESIDFYDTQLEALASIDREA